MARMGRGLEDVKNYTQPSHYMMENLNFQLKQGRHQSPTYTTLVEKFPVGSPVAAFFSPATSDAATDVSPATSTFSSSGEHNISAGTPITSPMEPNHARSSQHHGPHDTPTTGTHTLKGRRILRDATNKCHDGRHQGERKQSSSFQSCLELNDYDSGEEEQGWGGMSDAAPSLDESPTQDMLDQLRNMGFRETIARAATDACDDVSVAVQYACDHPMLKRQSHSNTPDGASSPSRQHYGSKMQDTPPRRSVGAPQLNPEAVRAWKISAVPSLSAGTGDAAACRSFVHANVPRSSSTSSSSSTASGSSTTTCATSTCSPSSFPRTDRQHQLAHHLLAIGFQDYEIDAAVKRCNSTPAAARFIMDGGVKGWERKMADVVFECAICMSDDLDETEMVTLDCEHRFCRECMKYHLDSLIATHQIKEKEMICPIPKCCASVSLPIIQNIISKIDYDKLLELKLHKEYAADNVEVRTCPKCSFMVIIEEPVENNPVVEPGDAPRNAPRVETKLGETKLGETKEGGEGQHDGEGKDNATHRHPKRQGKANRRIERHRKNTARRGKTKTKKQHQQEKRTATAMSKASKKIQKMLDCLECMNPDCKHKFCGRCGLDPHQRQKDQDISCQDYAAFCEANDASNEIFEEYLKENKMKRCPKCLLPAELKSGCNFIRCVCKSNYCYLCGRGLEESMHYSHYYKGPYGKRCYGGAKDKKGHTAQPACAKCKGKDCETCSKILDANKKSKLERIVAKRERDATRSGLFGWINKRFGKK